MHKRRWHLSKAYWFGLRLALSACLTFAAATVAGAQNAGSVTKLVVVVDGATNPEQIPDDLAYQHFFLAVAAHEQPSPQEVARQSAQLAPVGLAASDRQMMTRELGRMMTALEAIDAAERASDGSVTALSDLKVQRAAARARAITTVRGALSTEGASALDDYVIGIVKRGIKIYGTAN